MCFWFPLWSVTGWHRRDYFGNVEGQVQPRPRWRGHYNLNYKFLTLTNWTLNNIIFHTLKPCQQEAEQEAEQQEQEQQHPVAQDRYFSGFYSQLSGFTVGMSLRFIVGLTPFYLFLCFLFLRRFQTTAAFSSRWIVALRRSVSSARATVLKQSWPGSRWPWLSFPLRTVFKIVFFTKLSPLILFYHYHFWFRV